MRKLVVGAVAAVALALGFAASNASADWVTRTVYRWDPAVGGYVPVAQRVWVPDPVVVYAPSYYPDYYGYRPWYFPGYYRHHHHHEHHEHHHHH